MINVRVRVNNRRHRALPKVLVNEFESRRRWLLRHGRVKNNPTCFTFNESDIGKIKAANLVNPWNDLIEAKANLIQLRLTL